jgi:hypothetical protein
MFDPKNAILAPFLAIGLSCIASCSSTSTTGADEGNASVDQAASFASGYQLCPVTAATSVLVLSPAPTDGSTPACPSIDGRGGTWIPTARSQPVLCTANTATGSDAVLCSYDWSAWGNAGPDVAALQAIDDAILAQMGDGGDDVCSKEATLRYASLLHLGDVHCPVRPNGGPGPNAPKPCEICGQKGPPPGVVVMDIIMPPPVLDTMVVGLTNGAKQVITLQAPTSGDAWRARSTPTAMRRSSFIDVQLTRPPRGVSYVGGPTSGYGYNPPASP